MSKFNYSVKMTTSLQEMIKQANQVMIADLEKRFKQFSVLAEEEMPDALMTAIKNTEVYESLAYGTGSVNLRAEFGLDHQNHSVDAIDDIISAIVGELYIEPVQLKATSKGPSGSILLKAIHRSLLDALALDESYAVAKSDIIPWLNWLSFEGDRIVVSEYQIIHGVFSSPEPSRSGEAIMARSKTGFWKVPSQVSGTKENNWITRAVEDGNDHINAVLTGLLNRTF